MRMEPRRITQAVTRTPQDVSEGAHLLTEEAVEAVQGGVVASSEKGECRDPSEAHRLELI